MRYIAASSITDRQTDRRSDRHTQNDYRNPPVHAPRVNNCFVCYHNINILAYPPLNFLQQAVYIQSALSLHVGKGRQQIHICMYAAASFIYAD